MRKLMLTGVALALGALSPQAAVAQQQGSGTKVTGIVTEADEEMHKITINDETFVMPEEGGTALFPQEGDEVTLFYEEKGGEKVITRIGQPEE
jgi:Cu/Ag efflux protein CusF